MINKDIIYTSLETFSLKKKTVKSYKELDDDFVDWITESSIKQLSYPQKSEVKAKEELKSVFNNVYEQVYFMIKGRSFFLDFYIADKRIAIEIDGGYHTIRKIEDKERDRLFNSIGIRTIRIKANDVMHNKTITMLKFALTKRKRNKKSNKNKKCKIV